MSDTTNKTNAALLALQQNGACVGAELHHFELTIGEATVPLAVAEVPDAEFRRIIGNKNGYDRAELIAAAVRDPDGGVVFDKASAGRLKPLIARDLESRVMKFNGFDGEGAEETGNA